MTDHDFKTFLLQIALHQHSVVKNSFALSTATYQTITISPSYEQVLGVRAKVAATIFVRLGKDLQNTWPVSNSFFPGRNAALVNMLIICFHFTFLFLYLALQVIHCLLKLFTIGDSSFHFSRYKNFRKIKPVIGDLKTLSRAKNKTSPTIAYTAAQIKKPK
jgi:hypothetical protein